ncbi:MAG: SusD/RagB family nutrient-binding outer membrane lipoprotein [Desulfosporosinus sp.]|jgi:hypothetical protein
MKKIVSIILLSILIFTGCKDEFFDINDSPNKAIEDNMTPSLVLPRALHRMAAFSATNYDVYHRWLGYWSRSGTYGPNTDEEGYNLTSSFQRSSWLDMYDILKDVDVIENNAQAREETAYIAIAKILKSVGFMHLVDQYNNVPYSKAFDLANNLLTPYDKGEDVYADLIVQLDSADMLLRSAVVANNLDLTTADIMFKGNLSMWRKLGNSQRLRLIIHQSEKLGTSGMKTEIDKIVANGGGFLGVGETAEVQPKYGKDVGKQNPFWNSFKINDAGGLDNFNRANNYFLHLLMDNNDIRYKYFYSEASSPTNGENYYGFDYGYAGDDKSAAQSSDVAGTGPGAYNPERGLGIGKGPDMAQWFFTSFESLFLQAEAIQRGALSGDAKTTYETAVKESFSWLKVIDVDQEVATYLSRPFANWNSEGNTDKLKLILTQKYISMCGINGLETWTDYRRTGIPNVPLSVSDSRGSKVIPLRLIYPQEEYQYNAANATAEGTIDPQTSKIFWDN